MTITNVDPIQLFIINKGCHQGAGHTIILMIQCDGIVYSLIGSVQAVVQQHRYIGSIVIVVLDALTERCYYCFAGNIASCLTTNTIGRGPEQSVCLDFGKQQDDKIARDSQAKLTYDVKGNCFYIQHGEAANLTYLNDEPILEPKKLKAYDRITMGQTTLMFIPFCGKKFTWNDA